MPRPFPRHMPALRQDPRVEAVDDQRAAGGRILLTLRPGFTFIAGTGTRHTAVASPAEGLRLMRQARPGPTITVVSAAPPAPARR